MKPVKERRERAPIEIEVIPNVDAGTVGDVIGGGPAGETAGPPGPGRWRAVAAAIVVGVVALFLGVLIGASAGSDDEVTTGVTAPTTTDVPLEELLPGERLPAPTTTRPPRTTTTTTIAPPVVEAAEIDPRLVGVDLVLVGARRNVSLELLELDLSDVTLTRRDLGRVTVESVIAGDDWIGIVSPNGGLKVVDDHDPPQTSNLGEIWELVWQEGTDRFWRPDWESDGWRGPTLYEEVDITGGPTGVTLEVPFGGWAEHADPRGGLVIGVVGKHYSISEAGVSLIGVGELLGVSSDRAVLWDCDEQLRCGLFVVDRTTGVRSELPIDPLAEEFLPPEGIFGWGGLRSGTISPDGEMCAVILASEETLTLGLLDLRSGTIRDLGPSTWMPAVAWSPDSRFAFYLGDEGLSYRGEGGLRAYDRESGEHFAVFTESMYWGDGLSARPLTSDAPPADG